MEQGATEKERKELDEKRAARGAEKPGRLQQKWAAAEIKDWRPRWAN